MIYQANIHRYTKTKTKLDTKTIEVEANCLESFWNKVVRDNGFIHHSLHFLAREDDRNYLYRIKIVNRYKNETDFIRSKENGNEKTISNQCTA